MLFTSRHALNMWLLRYFPPVKCEQAGAQGDKSIDSLDVFLQCRIQYTIEGLLWGLPVWVLKYDFSTLLAWPMHLSLDSPTKSWSMQLCSDRGSDKGGNRNIDGHQSVKIHQVRLGPNDPLVPVQVATRRFRVPRVKLQNASKSPAAFIHIGSHGINPRVCV